jgi:hypothetical protein
MKAHRITRQTRSTRFALLISTLVISLVVGIAATAPRAQAAASLTIGPVTNTQATSNRSISIIDPCVSRGWSRDANYYYYGAYCGVVNFYWSYSKWHVYDGSYRFVGYWVCWSTPVQFFGCDWS